MVAHRDKTFQYVPMYRKSKVWPNHLQWKTWGSYWRIRSTEQKKINEAGIHTLRDVCPLQDIMHLQICIQGQFRRAKPVNSMILRGARDPEKNCKERVNLYTDSNLSSGLNLWSWSLDGNTACRVKMLPQNAKHNLNVWQKLPTDLIRWVKQVAFKWLIFSAAKMLRLESLDCSRIQQINRKLKVNRTASYYLAQMFEGYINLHNSSFS